jgi:hypothetical protein
VGRHWQPFRWPAGRIQFHAAVATRCWDRSGDGILPHPGFEQIIETYYRYAVSSLMHVSLDYQFVNNPAYNRDCGPVSVVAVRLHAQF